MGGHVACKGEIRIAYKNRMRNTQVKRSFGRLTRICEDNIRLDLK
jgi:hypothetical protein